MTYGPPLRERAQGRWRSILPRLGVDAKYLVNKHGPCPICLGGKDRFRFDDKDGSGSFICNQCGAGDGVQLVMDVNAWDFKEAAQKIEAIIGSCPREEAKAAPRSAADQREANNKLWNGALPVSLTDPVGTYLNRRIGMTEFPRCLRYHSNVRYFLEGDNRKLFFAAMLAKVSGPDGLPVNIHRTFLTRDGEKPSDIEENKMFMPGLVPKGSAVRLMPYTGSLLGIAEGVENAFSAYLLRGVPCWAALTWSRLSEWFPPDDVDEVIVFADNDQNYTGQKAAYTLANRLVVKSKIRVRVDVPIAADDDWNDIWQREIRERVAA